MKEIDEKKHIYKSSNENYGEKIKICPYCESKSECTGGSCTGGIAHHCKNCGGCFNSTRCEFDGNKYDGWSEVLEK